MADQSTEQVEQKAVKRYTSFEEFLREFYPKSTQHGLKEQHEDDGEFGVALAIDSLNRHAGVLRFRSE